MNIPKVLIFTRLCFAPIILILTYYYGESAANYILALMYIGLFTDIFDGIIARKQNISNEQLRRLDSQIDMLFWLSIGISTWFLRNDLLRENLIGLWTIMGMEMLCYVVSFIKFKKETCTHAILSKLWGITLLIAFTALLGFHQAGFYFYLCVVVGFLAHLDVILIILFLPKWTHDVPSSYHALKIRQGKEIKRNKLFNG
ncbi:CDP-alcohol phosphatidyltransferase family protein [Flavobacterium phycosphaerae]|uniref:CDP-alcohol phosphatidyltransferase family protein n=1 Tax=Flavobacterium phycosphaerae TaxID=2697515 RepID=UPI00138AC786|nr:CDP-alcohol phosphatidyltransferase family protein [Flavobacterium phycosphaerae]